MIDNRNVSFLFWWRLRFFIFGTVCLVRKTKNNVSSSNRHIFIGKACFKLSRLSIQHCSTSKMLCCNIFPILIEKKASVSYHHILLYHSWNRMFLMNIVSVPYWSYCCARIFITNTKTIQRSTIPSCCCVPFEGLRHPALAGAAPRGWTGPSPSACRRNPGTGRFACGRKATAAPCCPTPRPRRPSSRWTSNTKKKNSETANKTENKPPHELLAKSRAAQCWW